MNIKDLKDKSQQASQMLSLLANPHRLQILCALLDEERSVSSIEFVVDLSQSALSQHLAKLRGAGIVATRREAQSIYYSICDERALRLLEALAEIYCQPTAATARQPKKSK